METNELLKEIATKEGVFRASQHNFNQAEAGYNAKWFVRGALFGANWQKEKMYSEDDVLDILNYLGLDKQCLYDWYKQRE